MASSVPEFMISRCIQTFGAGGGWAVGGAVIGDIYRFEERGTALGVFFAVRISLDITMKLPSMQFLICTLY